MLPGVILPENSGMDFRSLEKGQLCAVNIAHNMCVCVCLSVCLSICLYVHVPYKGNIWQKILANHAVKAIGEENFGE